MVRLRKWWLVGVLLLAGGGQLQAATPAETQAYRAATNALNDGFLDRAERELGEFVTNHPASEYLTEAIVLQAQAQLQQRKYAEAIALLTARQPQADKRADEYLYWIGEAQFRSLNYVAAAETFGKLAATFPQSSRRLAASVTEAAAHVELGQWTNVVELLRKPEGAFQQAAAGNVGSELAARGFLLWAEAEFQQDNHAGAEAALQPVKDAQLAPELNWRRQYLLCRIQLKLNKTQEALQGSDELLTIAKFSKRPDLIGESVAFRASIFEQLGDLGKAAAFYELNLTPETPVERQRQALAKIVELALAQNQLPTAIQRLERFLGSYTNAPATDMALLTLGELQLRQHVTLTGTNVPAGGAPLTNQLQQALASFDRLINGFTNSPLIGKAQLGRGWCYWLAGQMPASSEAFKTAVALLPPSEDLAVARFKLADTLFAQNDFAGALGLYRGALAVAADWPRAREALTSRALYQALRASLKLNDRAAATEAMRRILEFTPDSKVAADSVLLTGQGFADAGEPEQAQALFKEFVEKFPEAEDRPAVELLLAGALEQKSEWVPAIAQYDSWLERFATNRMRPQAEFSRAMAHFHAGNETNALAAFTNFVTQFATHTLAPLAQWWVADYHWRRGEFADAELNYKLLFQTWRSSELAYPAGMMAGRAAVGWRNYQNASNHFTRLTSDTNCPADLRIEATLAYGGALMLLPPAETNKLANFEEAIRVFGTLPQLYPGTPSSAQAWGEIGNCYLQLAARDPASYLAASNAFHQVTNSPQASVALRSQAAVGLAKVVEGLAGQKAGAEKSALLKLARDHYLDVFYAKHLRDGETKDLFWVKEAGLGAVRVVESLAANALSSREEWQQVKRLCEALQELLPPLRPRLERIIAKAREQLPPEEN
jgi:TolA-binding protein